MADKLEGKDRSRIIEKIRACFALGDPSSGATEAEALNALTKARALMAEYNLSQGEVIREAGKAGGPGVEMTEQDVVGRQSMWPWERHLPGVCASLFDVDYYYQRYRTPDMGWKSGDKTKVVFVGFPVDVAIAIEAYRLLHLEVMSMRTEYTGKEREFFRDGVVTRLRKRAYELSQSREAMKLQTAAAENECRDLVVIKGQLVKSWMENKYPEMRSARPCGTTGYGSSARHEGYKAGGSISLDFGKQIK